MPVLFQSIWTVTAIKANLSTSKITESMEIEISQQVTQELRGPGRPRLSDEEKARRGTLKPCRVEGQAEDAVASEEVQEPDRDYLAIGQRYMTDVLSGRIPACTWTRLACERQLADRARWQDAGPFEWIGLEATAACAFIEQCPHVEGKWKTETITLEPAQVFWITCLFGWRQRADPALRRFTVFYLELGRKAGKSTLMAAIALYHLLREDEPGAKVVCGATTGSQARVVFGIMQSMVRRSRWLRGQGIQALANSIITEDGNAKPINAKASTQDGLNPSLICLDECHAQDFGLHDVLKSAQGARENPLLLAPTTAGYDLLSVGYALRTTLTKVLQGVFEAEHFLGFIYTLDEDDDWRDPAVWVKSNPMIGVAPKLKNVQDFCLDAQQTPGMEGEFRVKVCSQWMQSSTAWLSMTHWDACADPTLTLDSFVGQKCWVGADLAQLDDLAAVALLFERDGVIYAFVQYYLPAAVVEDRARTVPAYRQWVKLGILTLTEGTMIDYTVIESDIRAFCKRFAVQSIVFDQFGSAVISSNLIKDGYPAIVEPKNAKTFTPPARELEARVKHRRFRHDGNPCLKWNASNAVVSRRTDDSILPKKESPESPNKIDGIDAILEAWLSKLLAPPVQAKFQMIVLGNAS